MAKKSRTPAKSPQKEVINSTSPIEPGENSSKANEAPKNFMLSAKLFSDKGQHFDLSRLEEGAYARERMPRAFIIDEARLRGLIDIISKRLKEKQIESTVLFSVWRNDKFRYTTSSLEAVLLENNGQHDRVVSLDISAESKDFALVISFESNVSNYTLDDGSAIIIKGSDRDAVFLLFSDLKSYLLSEVNTAWPSPSDFTVRLISAIIVLLGGFAVLLAILLSITEPRISRNDLISLREENIAQKIDALLLAFGPDKTPKFPYAVFLIVFVLLPLFFAIRFSLRPMFKFFLPGNLFLIGKEVEKFEQMKNLRDKCIWGVIIALIIGVISSFIAAKFGS